MPEGPTKFSLQRLAESANVVTIIAHKAALDRRVVKTYLRGCEVSANSEIRIHQALAELGFAAPPIVALRGPPSSPAKVAG